MSHLDGIERDLARLWRHVHESVERRIAALELTGKLFEVEQARHDEDTGAGPATTVDSKSAEQGSTPCAPANAAETWCACGDSCKSAPCDNCQCADGVEAKEHPQDVLARAVYAMVDECGWSFDWTERAAVLFCEVAELIEAYRGKHGSVLEEAADVMISTMAVVEAENILWSDVETHAREKVARIRATLATDTTHGR